MRTAQFGAYGEPQVLKIAELPEPLPGLDEVVVRIHASSINQHDLLVRSGKLKMLTGSKFPLGTGLDFAGEAVAVGGKVTAFQVGERVWGTVPPTGKNRTAAAAEYVLIPASRLANSPMNLSDVEAAALCVVGVTAYVALAEKAKLKPGERALVRGAAGGVGAAAVQLAHAMGAHVTALVSAADIDYVRDLGADEVLDYRVAETSRLQKFHVIVDTAGTVLLQFRKQLAPGGRMVTVNFGSVDAMLSIAFSSLFGPKRIRSFSANPTRAQLEAITTYIRGGALKPQVFATFALEDIVAAHTSAEVKGGLGKRVLTF